MKFTELKEKERSARERPRRRERCTMLPLFTASLSRRSSSSTTATLHFR
uniref:Uncharacterized protein n=1 Tax=Cucumis melo TaxID=3656 RepID=A0A9I9DJ33_CUCME